ncbi:hypothetical protein FOIG_16906 [Fusarium odoratissimum NRRL 54006]|uniref:Uncharacterized protein n=2 Tax=Fusarium oxysporum species complex TaxID=171631 RepID=X0J0R0_FUSO5|nr:uncharacterized protein FOIG_16906 [Fusarium odoratissimum NRRL 54006]EXL89810.1 hypothetical protein FOIG_16906 [Fusarium odoratissimum NRRL 54006]TXB98003.1 hypothetical protein FocTR4_00017135 [Fusarium oxysporum f. sp. cubense]
MSPGTTKPNLAPSSAEPDDACGASGVHDRQFEGLAGHILIIGRFPPPDGSNEAQTTARIVEDSGETEEPLFMQNPSHYTSSRDPVFQVYRLDSSKSLKFNYQLAVCAPRIDVACSSDGVILVVAL